jgi:hypothetical protein
MWPIRRGLVEHAMAFEKKRRTPSGHAEYQPQTGDKMPVGQRDGRWRPDGGTFEVFGSGDESVANGVRKQTCEAAMTPAPPLLLGRKDPPVGRVISEGSRQDPGQRRDIARSCVTNMRVQIFREFPRP